MPEACKVNLSLPCLEEDNLTARGACISIESPFGFAPNKSPQSLTCAVNTAKQFSILQLLHLLCRSTTTVEAALWSAREPMQPAFRLWPLPLQSAQLAEYFRLPHKHFWPFPADIWQWDLNPWCSYWQEWFPLSTLSHSMNVMWEVNEPPQYSCSIYNTCLLFSWGLQTSELLFWGAILSELSK